MYRLNHASFDVKGISVYLVIGNQIELLANIKLLLAEVQGLNVGGCSEAVRTDDLQLYFC